MRIKRFAARDMADAMRQIRRELGPEAIIFHQRQHRDGGFWKTFKRPGVEVLAAIDTDIPATSPPARPEIQPARHRRAPADSRALLDIQRTVGEVHDAIARLENMTELPSQVSHFGDHLAGFYQQLLHQEVTRELAYDIVHQVFKELSPQALKNEPTVRSQVKAQMERQIRIIGPLRVVPGETRTIFIIGPTGVGKTTTLAKLGASFALNEQRRVALLTTDTATCAVFLFISSVLLIDSIAVVVSLQTGWSCVTYPAETPLRLVAPSHCEACGPLFSTAKNTHEIEVQYFVSLVHEGIFSVGFTCPN